MEDRQLYNQNGPVAEDPVMERIGSARIARPGRGVSLITIGRGVRVAHSAAEQLSQRSVEAEVIDLRSLTPVCTENLNPHVMMMKSAKYGVRFNSSGPINRARDRSIFIQRPVRSERHARTLLERVGSGLRHLRVLM